MLKKKQDKWVTEGSLVSKRERRNWWLAFLIFTQVDIFTYTNSWCKKYHFQYVFASLRRLLWFMRTTVMLGNSFYCKIKTCGKAYYLPRTIVDRHVWQNLCTMKIWAHMWFTGFRVLFPRTIVDIHVWPNLCTLHIWAHLWFTGLRWKYHIFFDYIFSLEVWNRDLTKLQNSSQPLEQ